MATFKFRLARIGKLKSLFEEQAKNAWQLAQKRLIQEQGKLQTILDEKNAIQEFGYGQTDLGSRQAMYAYLPKLDEKIKAQQEVLRNVLTAEKEAQVLWRKARQEKEMIEKLAEKAYQSFKAQDFKEEQNLLDELSQIQNKEDTPWVNGF